MGNHVSRYDYSKGTNLDDIATPEYFVTGDAEPELGLSQIFRSSVNGTDPSTPLVTGIAESLDGYATTETQSHFLWDILELGKKIAGGDANAFGVRTWKVPEQPYNWSEEQKAKFGSKYVETGYVERPDGSVDRFEYKYATFDEAEAASIDFMRGIVGGLGLKPFESKMAVLLPNRPEYYFACLGAWSRGVAMVPLYTTLAPDAIEVIFQDTKPEALVTTLDRLDTVEKALKKLREDNIPNPVQTIIVCDCILNNRWGNQFERVKGEDVNRWKKDYGVRLMGFSEVLQLGQQPTFHSLQPFTKSELDPETPAFILFTSGTTSETNLAIKGVILTHKGFMASIGASRFQIPVPKNQSILSFLPLSHVFQVCLDIAVLSAGSRVDFGSGDVRRLQADLLESQPWAMPAVPRILQRFYNGVFRQVDSAFVVQKWVVYHSYNAQAKLIRKGDPLKKSRDERVFRVIRAKLGLANCKRILVSAAPCPPAVLEFMRILLGSGTPDGGSCMLSYGMTESHGGLSTSSPGDNHLGHIGVPLPCIEYRLLNIPDMDMRYTDEEPKGELLLRGNSITPGYWNHPDENEKAYTTDSHGSRWFRTGDIVKINLPSGLLTVIDRRKNTGKLAQGEFVSLEKIVSIYSQSPLLSQVFPFINSIKSQIVGIVAPDLMHLYHFAVEKGWWTLQDAPVIGDLTPEVIQALKSIGEEHQEELVQWLKGGVVEFEDPLNSFERIKAFYVDTYYQDEMGLVFCEANGLLTPTLKLKTKFLINHYHDQLEQLYVKVGEPTPAGQPWY